MQKIVTQLKRHSVVDADTGRVDLRYNPMSIEEDYFIPVRAGSATDIQNLAGAQIQLQLTMLSIFETNYFLH